MPASAGGPAGDVPKRREKMQRLFTIPMLAATIILVPMFAWAGNQDVAERIAKNLKKSGQLSDYQIAVTFQNGTALLRGRVTSPDQLNTAMKIAFRTPGVNRVINELSIAADNPEVMATQYVPQMYVPAGVRPVAAQQIRASGNRANMEVARQAAPMEAMNCPPRPLYSAASPAGVAPIRYDQPCMPNYAWPSYAAYPNYAAMTYPKQYSPSAWPYIGPFYPYPQVPLEWRKVTLEWDDGWWFLDFKDEPNCGWHR
jgi:hypothetical protein